jgi:transposase
MLIFVANMYIESTTKGNHTTHLLRESYREGGSVKHHTLGNLTKCKPEEISAMKMALAHKGDLNSLYSLQQDLVIEQGLSFGGVYVIYQIAKRLGIEKALGNSRDGKLALWQIIARILDQGSRLSAVRLAQSHACCSILDLETFNEDDLYNNLDWIAERQGQIEDSLFRTAYKEETPNIYLYDVTSSYLEGKCNELGEFGYNRDGKKGKKQIVIGLLCDSEGVPLSTKVFKGNTLDPKTVSEQIKRISSRFGGKAITFVGDRGMIKSESIEELAQEGFHYITGITKPQIEKLLKDETLQMSLFDNDLAEITTKTGIRYVMRRNPIRQIEIQNTRKEKLEKIIKESIKLTTYLKEHKRAKEETAQKKILKRIDKLKVGNWLTSSIENREIKIRIDEEKLKEEEKLDGCYVLKTDIPKELANKETIESRYKDLSHVETAFRTSKTTGLELRPINVRLETRTRGHVFVVMLAYKIIKELVKLWEESNCTVMENIDKLKMLCEVKVKIKGDIKYSKIPEPTKEIKDLLLKADIILPEVFQSKEVIVATRKQRSKKAVSP